jgi:hypothetical protein
MIKVDLVGRIPVINPAPTKKELYDTALDVRIFMINRTKAGEDVNHRDFKEYSEAYTKTKAFQMQKRGNPNQVNLMLTGQMHRALRIKSAKTYSDIYYGDTNRGEIAYRHQIGSGVPKREHFGLNAKDERDFLSKLSQEISKRIAKEWSK